MPNEYLQKDAFLQNLVNLGIADTFGRVAAGALVDMAVVVSGAVQNTVYDLNVVQLPAGFLAKPGRGILVVAWGTTAGNANAKNLRLEVGGTVIEIITGTVVNAQDYMLACLLMRTGAAAQIAVPLVALAQGAIVAATHVLATPALDSSLALNVKHQSVNTAAAAASATGKGLVVLEISGS